MARPSEEISKSMVSSAGKPDSNLSNDTNNLGGIPAEEYATKQYVQKYHDNKELSQKEYIDAQDKKILEEAKEHANSLVRNQDFSEFAKVSDVQSLDEKLQKQITQGDNNQKEYTDGRIQSVVNDVNSNFDDVNGAISNLNDSVNDLFQSVSDGKSKIAGAITDKGVATSANDSFDTMSNNIRNIQTSGGGGETDPNYVNTSDATATADKILKGYTAYVQGKKVYGNFVYTGSNSGEYNPDNPYPSREEVELIYGEKENDIEVYNIGDSLYDVYDISSDKRLLVAYDKEEKKIKTYLRQGDNSYKQHKNQYGEYITPVYSMQDLGITENPNYELSKIKMSIMNLNENFSGYECKIALMFVRKGTEISESNVLTYVFRISTYNGEIKTENEKILAGAEGNTISYTLYNRWEIISSYEHTKMPIYCDLIWSPDSHTLSIVNSCYGINLEIYQFLDTTIGEAEDYSIATKKVFGNTIGSDRDSYRNLKFINQDRIILINWYTSYGGGGRRRTILIFNTDFSLIKKYTGYSDSDLSIENVLKDVTIISNDGLYGIGNNTLYSLTINYITGEISTTEIKNGTGIDSYAEDTMFTKDNKYLIITGKNNYRLSIFSVDFINATFTLLYSADCYELMFISGLKSAIQNYKEANFMIDTIIDSKDLVGLKYNGEIFYRNIYNPGRFTAGQPDVRKGKTFIGWMGTPETGTMEVENNE